MQYLFATSWIIHAFEPTRKVYPICNFTEIVTYTQLYRNLHATLQKLLQYIFLNNTFSILEFQRKNNRSKRLYVYFTYNFQSKIIRIRIFLCCINKYKLKKCIFIYFNKKRI